MTTHDYSELPLPLGALPGPGEMVTDDHVTQLALPLLETISAGLAAISEASFHSAIDNFAVHHATIGVIFQVQLVLHILERWQARPITAEE